MSESFILNSTSLSGLNAAVELQMYWRTNPIKHNVSADDVIDTIAFGSFD